MTSRQISIAFQTDKSPAQYVALAQLVDQYDFDAVSVYCDAPFHPSYGPLLLMAPHIRRARLGPAAVSPARIAPIDMAAETALLAQMASGGVYLGIARGAWLNDHGIHESDRPIQAIRESIEIVHHLLSGATGGYDGQLYQIAPHVRAPYPLPAKPIPVLIGTWGRRLCALAGELADEVKIGGTANPDIVPVIQRYIAVGEQKAGRQPGTVGVVTGAVTVIDEDRQQAREMARRAVSLYLPVVASLDPTLQIDPELIQRVQQRVNAHDEAGAARLISDDLMERFAMSGNAADIIRQSEALFAAGASRIEFGTPHGIQPETGIRILGQQVIPALRNH
ncbi:MAG: 5,10-methylene tetrahydromethanopterin reductase [Anaerolineaceae bacterium]|nr:5,10-methylene tetrahydromethanopterin reductase [Anaerolineaceae bacterium]